MQTDLCLKIRSQYQAFTRVEKKIADYVLEHREQVIFMNITELANNLGIGETSVFRFCKSLGLRGYQDFKMALSMGINNSLPNALLATSLSNDNSLVNSLLDIQIAGLQATAKLVNIDNIQKIVDLLIAAERIYLFGVGASMVVAMAGANRLLHITSKVMCFSDLHMQTMQASLLKPKDVALFISYSGETKDTISVAKVAKQAGATLIGITGYASSTLNKSLDYILVCGAKEAPLEGGSAAAMFSQMYLLELIYNFYYQKTAAISKQNNQITTAAVVEKFS